MRAWSKYRYKLEFDLKNEIFKEFKEYNLDSKFNDIIKRAILEKLNNLNDEEFINIWNKYMYYSISYTVDYLYKNDKNE